MMLSYLRAGRIFLVVMAGYLCAGCQSYFDATPRVWNDMALMGDLEKFDLVKASASDAQWIVAEIKLTPDSYVMRGTMQPDGRITTKVTVAGRCRILEGLGAKPEKMEWDFEFAGRGAWGGSGGSGGMPFRVSDGVSILRWNQQRSDVEMFPEGYRLPEASWAVKVAEAWKVAAGNRALFEPADAKKNVEALGEMTERGNPLLTIAAFRTLARGRVIAPSWGDLFIMNSKFPVDGVLMRDYLENLDAGKADEVGARFSSYLSGARSIEDVEGIALAASGIDREKSPGGFEVARRNRNTLGWRLGMMPGNAELRNGLVGMSHRWMFSD